MIGPAEVTVRQAGFLAPAGRTPPPFQVQFKLRPVDPAGAIIYESWARQGAADPPTLRDGAGRSYAFLPYDPPPPWPTRLGPKEPGMLQILPFESDAAGAEVLFLELPAANVGQTGRFRFRIPAAFWREPREPRVGGPEVW